MIKPALHDLRAGFVRHDRDLMVVGGAVRDWLLGEAPCDIDLATDATPEEQAAIYRAEKIRHFPTGLAHGTWTVKLADETVVEITSLHDGRYAWTRDWAVDLRRRDLTINAMALSFDGHLLDPFGGQADLTNRIVRFVGDASTRIREDHLRILRYLRFHAKIAGDRPHAKATLDTVRATKAGLANVARERIWREFAKIIAGPYGIKTLYQIVGLGIAPVIDLPITKSIPSQLSPNAEYQTTRDPVSLMAVYLGGKVAVKSQAEAWRWSILERQQGRFLTEVLEHDLTLDQAQALAARGTVKYWLIEGLRLHGKASDAETLASWVVPVFPVLGVDLVERGLPAGPGIGERLQALQTLWIDSGYRLTRTQLLAQLGDTP